MKIIGMCVFMLYISSCVMFDTRSRVQRNMEECMVRFIGEGATPTEARDACIKIYRPSAMVQDSSTDLKVVRD